MRIRVRHEAFLQGRAPIDTMTILDRGLSSSYVKRNLQYTRYKVTATRGIASCMIGATQNGKQITIPDVSAFVKAEVESKTVDDGNLMYLIDTDSLASVTSASNLMVTLEQGRR